MVALDRSLTVLDHSHVGPPAATTTATTLPFTLFDTFWVRISNINRLTFYEYPYPESHFIETIIPNLKRSLSQTLKHFHILAGKLFIPPDSSSFPKLRYRQGDGVSLTFARADDSIDFNHMVSNGPRNCGEFYPFVPQIVPDSKDLSSNCQVFPLLSLQVTLFPNVGISIGVTNHHAAGDANSIFRFVKAWATLSRDGGATLDGESLPLYDRSLVKDPKGIGKIWWDITSSMELGDGFLKLLPTTTNKVRATFVFDADTIQKFKNIASSKNPTLERLSTFVVVCAYVWTCMVKSRVVSEENVDEEETEHFGFAADARGRLDPPLPDNYFGNCLVYCLSTAKVKELIEEGGFVLAVKLMSESMKQRLYNKDGILSDAENWFKNMGNVDFKRLVGVAGSPKYNYHDLDFGFGLARKFEFVSIDEHGSIALSGSRDVGSVIEVGLSFPKDRMDAFIANYNEGIKALHL